MKEPVFNKNADRIENSFKFHNMTDAQKERAEKLRTAAREFALMIDELCPESREKSVALTDLETSQMYAVKAIAVNG